MSAHSSSPVHPADGYAGDITPETANAWMQSGEAVMVDVRSEGLAPVMAELGILQTLEPRFRTYPAGAIAMRELAQAQGPAPGLAQALEALGSAPAALPPIDMKQAAKYITDQSVIN